jgi:hypothetical protein
MEIHAPRHIGSWKEFFRELLTITIGILIALSLEGLLGWFTRCRGLRCMMSDTPDYVNYQPLPKGALAAEFVRSQMVASSGFGRKRCARRALFP